VANGAVETVRRGIEPGKRRVGRDACEPSGRLEGGQVAKPRGSV
jgi:hypothetical protein